MARTEKNRSIRRVVAIASAIATLLAVTLTAATAVTGEVYTGNISYRTAASHLLGATPRDPEVIAASFGWNRTLMVIRIHVVRANPYRRSTTWQVTQIAALDLFVGGREKMTDTITTSPGGPEGYSCGASGTHIIGLGTYRSATNTYTFDIPRSAFIKCGIRAGQVVHVLADSMMQTDNSPSGSNPWRFGTWAAQWSPNYAFRL